MQLTPLFNYFQQAHCLPNVSPNELWNSRNSHPPSPLSVRWSIYHLHPKHNSIACSKKEAWMIFWNKCAWWWAVSWVDPPLLCLVIQHQTGAPWVSCFAPNARTRFTLRGGRLNNSWVTSLRHLPRCVDCAVTDTKKKIITKTSSFKGNLQRAITVTYDLGNHDKYMTKIWCGLWTCVKLLIFQKVENLNSWQSLWPDN